jgi:hypothetical protein
MDEICVFPLCSRKPEHNGLCFLHKIYSGVPQEKKKAAPIPKKSDKRKVEEKQYKKIVKDMLTENNKCELNVQGVCIRKAQGLHHMKKRTGKNYLDKQYLKRACNPCNLFCETHPKEAMELGLIISKFKAA